MVWARGGVLQGTWVGPCRLSCSGWIPASPVSLPQITTTFPKDPVSTFSISQSPFPIENRDVLGETQVSQASALGLWRCWFVWGHTCAAHNSLRDPSWWAVDHVGCHILPTVLSLAPWSVGISEMWSRGPARQPWLSACMAALLVVGGTLWACSWCVCEPRLCKVVFIHTLTTCYLHIHTHKVLMAHMHSLRSSSSP